MDNILKLPFALETIRKVRFPRQLGILEKLYGRSLENHGIKWVVCSNNVVWKLDLTDPCHRWIVFGKYEGGNGIDYATSILNQGGVYIDSGANIGQWLLYLGHIPGTKTLAFEPVHSEREWLRECLAIQNNWNVEIVDSGLGSKNSEAEIQVFGSRSTLNMDWYKSKNNARNRIKIQMLEDVLDEKEIDTVDFWKLDVEGAELDALRGAKKYLKEKRIRHIYFECHPSNYNQIVAFLISFGYGVFDLIGEKVVQKTSVNITETENLVSIPLDVAGQ